MSESAEDEDEPAIGDIVRYKNSKYSRVAVLVDKIKRGSTHIGILHWLDGNKYPDMVDIHVIRRHTKDDKIYCPPP